MYADYYIWSNDMTFNKAKAMPWITVGVWVCVIWGHSVMNSVASGMESQMVVGLVRGFINWFLSLDFGWVRSILKAHPELSWIFGNNEQLHFYVRKAGHFVEYFILGQLVLRACRRTIDVPRQFAVALCALWICTPFIDETIQLFIPGRDGQIFDMLLDMGGYASGILIALPFIGLAALTRMIATAVAGVKKGEGAAEEDAGGDAGGEAESEGEGE